jgi:hypothetical protein
MVAPTCGSRATDCSSALSAQNLAVTRYIFFIPWLIVVTHAYQSKQREKLSTQTSRFLFISEVWEPQIKVQLSTYVPLEVQRKLLYKFQIPYTSGSCRLMVLVQWNSVYSDIPHYYSYSRHFMYPAQWFWRWSEWCNNLTNVKILYFYNKNYRLTLNEIFNQNILLV